MVREPTGSPDSIKFRMISRRTSRPRFSSSISDTWSCSSRLALSECECQFISLPGIRQGASGAFVALLEKIGTNQVIQIAVEDLVYVADFEVGSVVLDEAVGLEDVRANLAPPGDLFLCAFFGCALLIPLALRHVVQPRAEDLHGHVSVPVLGAFILAGSHEARREGGDANRGVGHVCIPRIGAVRTASVGPKGLLLSVERT